MMLSSGFLKQQRLCGNSFGLSFCLPLPADQFQPNLVDKRLKVNPIPIRLERIDHWVEEGFKVVLLTERTEPSAASSGLLSQRVDVPRQASAHCLLCTENLVGKRQRGPESCGKGIAN